MFSFIWHTFFFDPIYNLLVFFLDIIPGGDMGLAIIATVIMVKAFLFPLSIKGVKMQKMMRDIEPQIKALQEKHKDDRNALGLATMELYREKGINPFVNLLALLVQIPVVIALSLVALRGSNGIKLPHINHETLYSFVHVPDVVSIYFFGHFNIAAPSIILAICAAASQYVSTSLSLPKLPPKDTTKGAKIDFKDDFNRNMHLQMKYAMPVITGFMSSFSATMALYFIVSSATMIAQELIVKRHR
jgi:YidC/Oxa1 family membrane protein insertase